MILVLFNPWFLAVVGVVLGVLKVTNLANIPWLVVALPFVIRPIVIGLVNFVIGLIVSYETKDWRKDVKVGDYCFFINIADKITDGKVEQIDLEKNKVLVHSYTGTLSRTQGWRDIKNLYPLSVREYMNK